MVEYSFNRIVRCTRLSSVIADDAIVVVIVAAGAAGGTAAGGCVLILNDDFVRFFASVISRTSALKSMLEASR